MRIERLSRADRGLVAVCVAVIAVGTAIGATLFSRAFPEASIDFRVTREEARRVAERALAARGFDVAGRKALGVFDHDDEAKVFLERELGLDEGGAAAGAGGAGLAVVVPVREAAGEGRAARVRLAGGGAAVVPADPAGEGRGRRTRGRSGRGRWRRRRSGRTAGSTRRR